MLRRRWRASRERTQRRRCRPRSGGALTPQELNIATLVAEGKSNKEIAAAVYLSPKTIEYHLANTFRKLNFHSRAELARLMGTTE